MNGLVGNFRTNTRRLLRALVLISVTLASVALTTAPAFADTQIGSGTAVGGSGGYGYGRWEEVLFYTYVDQEGQPAGGVYNWVEFWVSQDWQTWYSTAGQFDYLLMTHDFWRGIVGDESGSGEPSNLNYSQLYVSNYNAGHYDGTTLISTAVGNGTCSTTALPAYEPCDQSNLNTNGHHFITPYDYGRVFYESAVGNIAASPNGVEEADVLHGSLP